jgi:hypothetical protein
MFKESRDLIWGNYLMNSRIPIIIRNINVAMSFFMLYISVLYSALLYKTPHRDVLQHESVQIAVVRLTL